MTGLSTSPPTTVGSAPSIPATTIKTRAERSDNGNLLMDAHFPAIEEPALLAPKLEAIPGLVEHGLFLSEQVERVIVAGSAEVRELVRQS